MRRFATAPLAAALLFLLGAPFVTAGRGRAEDALESAGWRRAAWPGVPAARFDAAPGGDGVAVRADGAAGFAWRPVQGSAGCLHWRWRVEQGPPATDLTRRGGDDRAVSIAVGFAGWPSDAGAWQRARHGIAQARAGSERPLPRSVLLYVWGGTGREPALFTSPYLGGLAKVRVVRPADAPRGRWLSERVDLAADWRAAFGGEPPPMQEVAVGTDTDDTGTLAEGAVAGLRFAPCG